MQWLVSYSPAAILRDLVRWGKIPGSVDKVTIAWFTLSVLLNPAMFNVKQILTTNTFNSFSALYMPSQSFCCQLGSQTATLDREKWVIPRVLGYCDSVGCVSEVFCIKLHFLGSLSHLHSKNIVKRLSQLLPHSGLGFEDSWNKRSLLRLLWCKMSSDNGDSLLWSEVECVISDLRLQQQLWWIHAAKTSLQTSLKAKLKMIWKHKKPSPTGLCLDHVQD